MTRAARLVAVEETDERSDVGGMAVAALDLDLELVIEQRRDQDRAQRRDREPADVGAGEWRPGWGRVERGIVFDAGVGGGHPAGRDRDRRVHRGTGEDHRLDAERAAERRGQRAAHQAAQDPAGSDQPEDPLRLVRIGDAVDHGPVLGHQDQAVDVNPQVEGDRDPVEPQSGSQHRKVGEGGE